jgi:hypothetical protein
MSESLPRMMRWILKRVFEIRRLLLVNFELVLRCGSAMSLATCNMTVTSRLEMTWSDTLWKREDVRDLGRNCFPTETWCSDAFSIKCVSNLQQSELI